LSPHQEEIIAFDITIPRNYR